MQVVWMSALIQRRNLRAWMRMMSGQIQSLAELEGDELEASLQTEAKVTNNKPQRKRKSAKSTSFCAHLYNPKMGAQNVSVDRSLQVRPRDTRSSSSGPKIQFHKV